MGEMAQGHSFFWAVFSMPSKVIIISNVVYVLSIFLGNFQSTF